MHFKSHYVTSSVCWLVVLRSAQEYFVTMETSPLAMKPYARGLLPLSREGSLSCYACCNTGPWFLQSHPSNDRPSLVAFYNQQRILGTNSIYCKQLFSQRVKNISINNNLCRYRCIYSQLSEFVFRFFMGNLFWLILAILLK